MGGGRPPHGTRSKNAPKENIDIKISAPGNGKAWMGGADPPPPIGLRGLGDSRAALEGAEGGGGPPKVQRSTHREREAWNSSWMKPGWGLVWDAPPGWASGGA